MKVYKKLLSFGCSFTEGGGLNAPVFHRFLRGEDVSDYNSSNFSTTRSKIETILPEHIEYATYHSYPGYLSRILNCDFLNFGSSGASNEYIFNKAYQEIQKIANKSEALITIQTSFLNRITLQLPLVKGEVNINMLEGIRSGLSKYPDIAEVAYKYYESYLGYFFDTEYSYKILCRDIDIFSEYCKSKNLDVVFLMYDKPVAHLINPHPLVVDLGYRDLDDLLRRGKLAISHLTNHVIEDGHFSERGNEVVANLIFKYVKNVYG